MRVLVTGHKGYIGTVLVPALIADGHRVVGLDSDLFAQCTFGDPGYDGTNIPHIRKDIRDVEPADLEGFDAIVHLAGLSNDALGSIDPRVTLEINHLASVRLATFAKKAGVTRFVFSSSCSAYGAQGDELADENVEPYPLTPYAHSKVLAEQGVARLADSRFSPSFLRSATAYGVSPRLRFDLVLNNLVAWAHTTGRVYIKSDGTPWRPVVHVQDIARAFVAVLRAPRALVHNETFNVGSTEENYRIRDLAEIVQETVPGSRVEYAKGSSSDARCYRVDCNKLGRSLPEFQLSWSARSGARQLYEAYQARGLRQEDFEGSRYSRIDHIRHLQRTGHLDGTFRWIGS
jgi:nucleoside-diphosphate-sugar epimerase